MRKFEKILKALGLFLYDAWGQRRSLGDKNINDNIMNVKLIKTMANGEKGHTYVS